PRQDHPTGNQRSTATAQDRKDNSFLEQPFISHYSRQTSAALRQLCANLTLDQVTLARGALAL
ncbi:hypothetical protein K4749_40720, partial [Streptomyces sp. TRM72054]|uniref:hypothetical protein n=1 Tax=Streptomyces sp. TRM72054 TaxID=2870562 RepID=UPI001C8CAD5C